MTFRSTALALAVAAWLSPGAARAEMTKHECVEANAQGQNLFIDGKLSAARTKFQSCAVAACPQMIQNDCIRRLDQVDAIRPAILFEAKDASGRDLSEVTVTIDGAPLADRLEGTPIGVDPGRHTFVFSSAGLPAVTKTLVLAERDQARRELVVFAGGGTTPAASPAPAAPTSTSPAEPLPPPSGDGRHTFRILGITSTAVGVVGVGIGVAFAALANSANNGQNADCGTTANCPDHAGAVSERSTYQTDTAVEIVGFSLGGLLLATGVTLLILSGKESPHSAASLVLSPAIAPNMQGLTVQGEF